MKNDKNAKKIEAKENATKSINAGPKTPKMKKEKKVPPKGMPIRKRLNSAQTKKGENSGSSQKPSHAQRVNNDEQTSKTKSFAKMKDKDLNDRVKNQIRLMLSSSSSSNDTTSVVKGFEKSNKTSGSPKKTNNNSEVKQNKKLETKKQNGITNLDIKKERAGCSPKKSTKPSSPKKCTNSSKTSRDLLSKSVADSSSDSLSVSKSKTDRKSTVGATKRPSISTKSSKPVPCTKAKNKQADTKSIS